MNDLTRVIRDCQRAGLAFVPGRKHGRLIDPRSGRYVVVSSSPSCRHAFKNVRRDVRKILGVLV